ncbi:endoglucanase Cel9M [Clostridium sp. DSM 8431]|uniref:glycoside hydrolase family 9 protein n=1 Tax=Clostridium sp. DSM 8431 TaxID=1761781 RepID=UPI0008F07206|nr:glycoside hydrolase family 9 protein [Clostridium sp. DSM 8431]SFU53964.1 endoglucanase Cel9M [Clostridium sp. DSM 8431]
MLRRNKALAYMLSVIMGLSIAVPGAKAYAFTDDEYKTALKDSVNFYDANKCGKEVANDNVFSWRGPCHLNDGKNLGIDLTGGYHDAGDCVKFGLPQSYSASVMGWALYEFKDGFKKAGAYNKQLGQLKYFTDYIIKCHYADGKFVYQVGDGDQDHNYWGAPENEQDGPTLRQSVRIADSAHSASDVLGESTAALALMYLNYKDKDSAYAEKCLKEAKELYEMGKANPGRNDLYNFYVSGSYSDDMAWGATWLYEATKDQSYLNEAKQFLVKENPWLESNWTMCWNDMKVPTVLKLYEITKDATYKKAIEYNLNYWENDLRPVKGGIKIRDDWGSLRYTAAESMLALVYNKINPSSALTNFASSQINYILGDNPDKMSYQVGFGNKWPQHAHHRAANGYDKEKDANYKTLPNKYVLTGALVGGPKGDGTFKDELDEYTYTEVALDYNAGWVGALAGYVELNCSGEIPIDPPIDIPTGKLFGDVNDDKEIDLSDYTLFRKYLNNGGENSNIKINTENADVNEDGNINFFDLVALKALI